MTVSGESYARARLADGSIRLGELLDDGSFAAADGGPHDPSDIEILPPVIPSKLVCVGFNYHAHADEMTAPVPDEPLLFMKPPSSVVAHGEAIRRPPGCERLDYEGELAVVIGREARRVSADEALECVEGLTIANDATARQYQTPGSQWTKAKGYDTFAPIGPSVVRSTEWSGRTIETRLNGTVVQSSTTDRLIFDVPTLIAVISSIMTLFPGDLILTGTPAGVGPMADGDVCEVTIEGIGTLRNVVEGVAGQATATTRDDSVFA